MSERVGTVLGTVVSLWRYPVKSMLGEELNAAQITKRGSVGDRAYAVVEPSTGRARSCLRCESPSQTAPA